MRMKKVLISVMVCVCMLLNTLSVIASAEEDTLWRMDAIKIVLSELSVMQGDPDGNMRYDDVVSRAEFAKIAVMASAYRDYVVPEMKISVFPDVKSDNWASPYVWAGVKNSVFSGYPDGNFRPNNTVLYEEAATVFLKLLGYTDSDIGPSWPYGPIKLAGNAGLSENINVWAGKELTRYDVANMAYNLLKASDAKTGQDYITNLGLGIIENCVVIAGYKQDTGVGANNIYTSSGTFERGKNFSEEYVGLRGDLVVKDNKKALCVIPSGQKKVTYEVTGTVGGGLMLDGKLFNIDDNMSVYYGKQQYPYKNLYSLSINEGDEFSLIYSPEGYVDYALLTDASKSFGVEEIDFGKYIVYSVVNNDVILYKDSKTLTYNIPDSTPVYKDDAKLTYSSVKASLSMGDVLYLSFKESGKVDYAKYEEGTVFGPVLAKSSWQDSFGVNKESISVMRNGSRASVADIGQNDILYYIEDLNLILAYYKTATGVYEKAIPNRDTPTSVTISGKTYEIEGIEAFNKLSSSGNLMLGDTVTVVFGRDNKIADVITDKAAISGLYGYLVETGTGRYTDDDNNDYSSFYAKVVLPNGEVSEFNTSKDYEKHRNKIVRVTINDGKANLTLAGSDYSVSGKVNWSRREIGIHPLADDVFILDIRTTNKDKTPGYVSVFPQRLDGITLTESDVCFFEKNSAGEISALILNDVTGDAWSYGILASADKAQGKLVGFDVYSKGGSYYTTTVGIGGMAQGKCIQMAVKGNSIESISMLSAVQGVYEITNQKVFGNTTHTISDRVEVYVRSGDISGGYEYNYADISNAVGIDRSKIVSAYYDKTDSKGGRIRVIVITE